jgi:aspartyl-tRNA synthetase
MGVDRINALLTQQDNLRDTILFPLMKSEKQNSEIRNQKLEESDSSSRHSELDLESGESEDMNH